LTKLHKEVRRGGEVTKRRRGAHLYGLKAESIASVLLRLKGYTILARRFVVSGGEIDLVARRGGMIAFVEVKARADLDSAAISISAMKQRRIARAARVWLARNPWAAGLTLRGDAIFVAPWRLPRHAPSAYSLEID
jgi:putative endonuclease